MRSLLFVDCAELLCASAGNENKVSALPQPLSLLREERCAVKRSQLSSFTSNSTLPGESHLPYFGKARDRRAHVGQLKQRRAPHLIRGLPPEFFMLQVARACGIWINGNLEASNQRLAGRRGEAHMRIETGDQHAGGSYRVQPFFKSGAGERPVHIFLEQLFRSEIVFRS